MNVGLDGLPTELLVRVLDFLPVTCVVAVSRCCRRLRLVAELDAIWDGIIKREFRLDAESWRGSRSHDAKTFYAFVLSRYGRCLGLWRRRHFRGWLLHLDCLDGALLGRKITPPKDVRDPVNNDVIFSISLDPVPNNEDLEDEFDLTPGLEDDSAPASEQCAVIDPVEFDPLPNLPPKLRQISYFKGKPRSDQRVELRHRASDEEEELILETVTFPSKRQTREFKKSSFSSSSDTFERIRGQDPSSPTESTYSFQPGIYKGTYRDEGVELIDVYYDSDAKLIGRKFTGDQYVPAGQISFKCRLDSPLHPTPAQLQRMESLRLVKVCQNPNCLCPKKFPVQPLRIPIDCHPDLPGFALPETSTA